MKKVVFLLIVLAAIAALLVDCGGGNLDSSANNLPYPARITLVPVALTVPKSNTAPVTATVYDQFGKVWGGTIYWSPPSNSTIAAVCNDATGANPETVTVCGYEPGETTFSVSAINGPPPYSPTVSLVVTVTFNP